MERERGVDRSIGESDGEISEEKRKSDREQVQLTLARERAGSSREIFLLRAEKLSLNGRQAHVKTLTVCFRRLPYGRAIEISPPRKPINRSSEN